MALSQVFAKAATGKVNKTTKVAIEVGGRKVRAEIQGEPTDTDFESRVDAAARDIEADMRARGLIKKAPEAKQPAQGSQNPILGGTIFDPSRKPQQPVKPAKKPTPLQESEQAARNVIQSKTGKEFVQRSKELGDAQNRAALADAMGVQSRQGDPNLVGDEGLAPKRKQLGGKDGYQQFQGLVGTAARTVAQTVSPALKLDNAQDQKALDQMTGALLGVPGSPEEVVLNLGLAALGPVALRVAGAAIKARPNGTMRDIAQMLFSQEGRTAIKQADPQVATAVEAASQRARATFTPKAEAGYDPGQSLDLVGLARTGELPKSKPIPGSSPELQGPSTPPIPDVPPVKAETAPVQVAPASTPIPGSSPELQGPMVPNPTQKLDRTVADASPDLTSGRNAMTANDRVLFGLDELPPVERKSFEVSLDNARKRGFNTEESALVNAREAIEKGRILNDEESAGITEAIVNLKNRDTELIRQINAATDPAEIASLQAQRSMIADKADTLTQGINATGTSAARALSARRLTLNEALDPVSLKVEAKGRAGRPLTPEEDAYFDQLGQELQDLQRQVDEANTARQAAEKAAELARAQQVTVDLSQININPRRRAANAQRRAVAAANISSRFEQLAKESLSSMGAGPDVTKYAAFLKEIAPDVMVIVKTLAEDGITLLDDVVKRTKEEVLRLTNGKVELTDDDVVGIIGGKYRETRPVSEQRSAVTALRTEAKNLLKEEERAAVQALREAKASEKAARKAELDQVRARQAEEAKAWKAEEARLERARKAELAEAVAQGKQLTRQERAEYESWWRSQMARMSAEDRKAFAAWQAEEKAASQAERMKLDAAARAGRQQAADARREYAKWWTENTPNESAEARKSYVQWWNETAPAEAERLQRSIERQEQFLADPKLPEGRKKPTEFDENEELRIRLAAKKVERDYQLNLLRSKDVEEAMFTKANNWLREAKASMDTGHVLNQGGFHMIANPKEWFNATIANFRYAFHGVKLDDQAFFREVGKMRAHKDYEAAKAAKLGISDTGAIGTNEIRVAGDNKVWLLSKVPGFERSNKMYAIFVQKLRLDTFSKIKSASEVALGRKLKLSELKDIAEYVNITTGKGVGPIADSVAKLPLFAGGFAVSRFQQALLPFRAIPMLKKNPVLAKRILVDYMKVVGGISSMVMLAKASGAEVNLDLQSSKFLHAKFGDKWYDLGAGMAKPLVVIAQIVAGRKTADGKTQRLDPAGVVGDFITGKLGPGFGVGFALFEGKSFGKPMGLDNLEGVGNFVGGAVLPIYIEQQVQNIFKDPDMTPEQKTLAAILGLFNIEGKDSTPKKADPEKSRPLSEIVQGLLGRSS